MTDFVPLRVYPSCHFDIKRNLRVIESPATARAWWVAPFLGLKPGPLARSPGGAVGPVLDLVQIVLCAAIPEIML